MRTTITIDRQVVEDIAKVDNNLSGFIEDSARKELKRRKRSAGQKAGQVFTLPHNPHRYKTGGGLPHRRRRTREEIVRPTGPPVFPFPEV